ALRKYRVCLVTGSTTHEGKEPWDGIAELWFDNRAALDAAWSSEVGKTALLQHPPLVLDQRQRERYFEDGFLTVPGYVGAAWLDRLRAVVAAKIEESRMLTAS